MSEQVHKPLKEHHLPASGCSLLNTFKPKNVTATDPAEAVMTDLRKVASASIRAEASLERAHQMMIQRGVRMLMVANDEGLISGVITSNDVMGEKPLTVAQKHGIKRGELKVRDIMRTGDRLPVAPDTVTVQEAILRMTKAKSGSIALVAAKGGLPPQETWNAALKTPMTRVLPLDAAMKVSLPEPASTTSKL